MKTQPITRHTYLVVWQYAVEGHLAGEVVSKHANLIEAEQAALGFWAWGIIQV